MLKQLLKCCALALLPFCATAQVEVEWAKTYQGNKTDKAFAVVPAANGGLAILGRETLSCTDKNGNKLWETKLPYDSKDHTALTALKNGGYILTGSSNESDNAELIVTRVDKNGKILWTKLYQDKIYTIGNSILELSDGNYMVGGWRFGDEEDGGYVAKIDQNGKMLWEKFHDLGKGEDYFTQGTADKNGGAVFVGSRTNGFRDASLVAIDANGSISWQNSYGVDGKHEDGYAVEATKDGYLVVSSGSVNKAGKFTYNAMVNMVDKKGKSIWKKTFGADGLSEFYDIAPTLDGNFILAGTLMKTSEADANVWLMQIDKNGSVNWERFYGGSNEDEVSSICLTTDGMFAAAGFTEYAIGEADDEDDASFINNVWALKFKELVDGKAGAALAQANEDQLELDLDLDINLDDIDWDALLADVDLDLNLDEEDAATPKVWAVLVGVSDYAEAQNKKGWSDLRYCHSDAQLIYDFITSPKGGSLPKEQVKILKNSEASKEAVLKACEDIYSKARKHDLIIFYFSGHGGPNVFAAHDGLVEHNALQDIINASAADKRLCIADACYSGSWNANKTASENPLTDEQMKEIYYDRLRSVSNNMALLMSSSKSQPSLELGAPHRQSLFTMQLIEGLAGGADEDGDKIVSIQELYIYVKFTVYNKSRELGSVQTPQLQGFFDTGMPVGVVR